MTAYLRAMSEANKALGV